VASQTTHSITVARIAGDGQAERDHPLVSIGLPVFNGALFLEQALDALSNQSYENIEIIVSDNASTDATPEICARYAAMDRRIRYSRLAENIGGIPNHNRVFSLARGKYFMWASHDDLFERTYVARCVECLEKDAGAVLAYAMTSTFDEAGRVKPLVAQHLANEPRAAIRFSEFTALYSMLEAFYGVIRREVLERTMLHLLHPGSDRILLAELSLHGRFVQVPEHLFKRRLHTSRSVAVHPDIRERYSWIAPALKGKRVFPHWGYLAGYVRAVLRTPLALREKASCAYALLRLVRYSWKELLADLKP
jgi:glycosyltransferase involved in cell wall biosynthesis